MTRGLQNRAKAINHLNVEFYLDVCRAYDAGVVTLDRACLLFGTLRGTGPVSAGHAYKLLAPARKEIAANPE